MRQDHPEGEITKKEPMGSTVWKVDKFSQKWARKLLALASGANAHASFVSLLLSIISSFLLLPFCPNKDGNSRETCWNLLLQTFPLLHISYVTAAALKDSHTISEMWHQHIFWPPGAVYANPAAQRHKKSQVLSSCEGQSLPSLNSCHCWSEAIKPQQTDTVTGSGTPSPR